MMSIFCWMKRYASHTNATLYRPYGFDTYSVYSYTYPHPLLVLTSVSWLTKLTPGSSSIVYCVKRIGALLQSREQGGKWQEEKVGFRLTELSLADLRTVPVPLPSLDEQRRIAAYLDSLEAKADAIRAAQLETQRELDALMPAVLDRAFRGKL